MKIFTSPYSAFTLYFLIAYSTNVLAEGSCPPGQYPIGGQGIAACAPIPQGNSSSEQSYPSGKWVKTWGAVAVGTLNNTPYYGVPTGRKSKSDATKDALNLCAKKGPTNCKVTLTYFNQCAAIAEPQNASGEVDMKGNVIAVGKASLEEAKQYATEECQKDNKTSECKVIYNKCSEPFFKEF
ncbi:DUF4189 domain-containing protein [Xanthomonas euvesicatoria pv. eucalypti]|uniref:DUF4189 domain-containing protein n=1 Tax=Xanthomonas TaxID=338 RepID=UPI001C46439B|nr:DUF4189 domain-containing protein [Xanthomonas euvesicatoria]MBV6854413.1 DUF4189 domain-containing protein [Xanthomonas campestris pv. mirabilis]MCC8914410.1 DUF4189 domain-containing protein [Xanthomonas euvesicatoria]MDO7933937.1 DUF4189 domain-containing protein [Xanthomonas euvesicatoria pv. eucalypti]MDO7937819.1 DUF4189 domain-containing protein [Xanthomonas euvesicatoria pv. eucalypti]MDO7940419.1 DUF4189 domain-containing protein [Xanthomonas euvesicatoria pv. eucalypti]